MTPEQYIETGTTLKWLLGIAWLLPLVGFTVEIFGGYWGKRLDPASHGKKTKLAAYMAVFCIGTGFLLSLSAFVIWKGAAHVQLMTTVHASEHVESHDSDHGEGHDHHHGHDHNDAHEHPHGDENLPPADDVRGQSPAEAEHHEEHGNDPYAAAFSGTFYELAHFGDLRISIDYYIDGLTLLMFCMVTLIATCIHIFAIGYMSDELTEDYEDHFVHLPGGKHFHRPGRFYRFFAFLSLFSFSMLGLVLAGNIFQVFVFWELVGVCSYLLIGFYVERHSASTAANKAFIMNRVGDFGFLIGLMILWTYFGTFQFANTDPQTAGEVGLFQMVRDADGHIDVADTEEGKIVILHGATEGNQRSIPYWLLIAAGIGIFGGCIGKSAQFPLQPWLPDAMEGPTPVSALVHSATMVAAGVYLTGRFYPMFTPEVLLAIAYIGCITLFIGATIAIVATDIKRVLAYSTISQLGYMMLALGVGGWVAGLYHLITHAFFKSLMFLCSGSVIHGCHHEQEMTKMGGLSKKMPITCWTMFVGVVAISGLAIPVVNVGLSGFYSKDAIVASALAFMSGNPNHFLLFLTPLVTAGITAFYMFRLWFMTFAGPPKDQHVYDHAHESPSVMTIPLIILSVFAIGCAWFGILENWILTAEPAHVATGGISTHHVTLAMPSHHVIHGVHDTAGIAALFAAVVGAALSAVFYWKGLVDPAVVKRSFSGVHHFLVEKWQFDNLYDAMFVRPVHVMARWCTLFDQNVLDAFLHSLSRLTIATASWNRKFDETFVDGLVNIVGSSTYKVGRSLQVVQTGKLRQYVMFIALGVLGLFVLLFMFFPRD